MVVTRLGTSFKKILLWNVVVLFSPVYMHFILLHELLQMYRVKSFVNTGLIAGFGYTVPNIRILFGNTGPNKMLLFGHTVPNSIILFGTVYLNKMLMLGYTVPNSMILCLNNCPNNRNVIS